MRDNYNYIILNATSSWELSEQVNSFISRGYKPVGGISSVVASVQPIGYGEPLEKTKEINFFQAMSK